MTTILRDLECPHCGTFIYEAPVEDDGYGQYVTCYNRHCCEPFEVEDGQQVEQGRWDRLQDEADALRDGGS